MLGRQRSTASLPPPSQRRAPPQAHQPSRHCGLAARDVCAWQPLPDGPAGTTGLAPPTEPSTSATELVTLSALGQPREDTSAPTATQKPATAMNRTERTPSSRRLRVPSRFQSTSQAWSTVSDLTPPTWGVSSSLLDQASWPRRIRSGPRWATRERDNPNQWRCPDRAGRAWRYARSGAAGRRHRTAWWCQLRRVRRTSQKGRNEGERDRHRCVE